MGVPQGSVLGPLLFILFINDIPTVIKHSSIVIYADDIKLYKQIKSASDQVSFQEDINAVCSWLQNNGLSLSTEKCGILKIGERFFKSSNKYHIAGNDIEEYQAFRDLGVQINSQLNFDSHIKTLADRANKSSKCLKNAFSTPGTEFRLQMHKTFVLPLLESFSPIWSPCGIGNIKLIESVQRGSTKQLCQEDMAYQERCNKLEIRPLIERRYITDLITVHKLIHGKFDNLTYTDFLSFNTSVTRAGSHSLRIKHIGHKSAARRNFLVGRITGLWNKLPYEAVMNHPTKHFKTLLKTKYNGVIQSHIDNTYPTIFK